MLNKTDALKRPEIKKIVSVKNNKIISDVKNKKSTFKKNNVDEVLPGNGHHRAVGLIKGVLVSSVKIVKNKAGETIKVNKYKLVVNSEISINANLIFGARCKIKNKPGDFVNIEHTFITYPKYNKKGEFSVDIIAYDDNGISDISGSCQNLEFIFVGLWKKGKFFVQQNKDKKKNIYNKIKKSVYKFDDDSIFEENTLYHIKSFLCLKTMKLKILNYSLYDI